jgi:hypothetical protein
MLPTGPLQYFDLDHTRSILAYSEFHIAPQTSTAKPQGTAARALI